MPAFISDLLNSIPTVTLSGAAFAFILMLALICPRPTGPIFYFLLSAALVVTGLVLLGQAVASTPSAVMLPPL